MSSQREGAFMRLIHKRFPVKPYFVKMHNPYAAGIPDAFYSGKLGDLWAEYKFLKELPKRQVTLKLTEQQKAWILGRREEGRSVWVIAGLPRGKGFIVKDNAFLGPIQAEWITANLLDTKQIAREILLVVGEGCDATIMKRRQLSG